MRPFLTKTVHVQRDAAATCITWRCRKGSRSHPPRAAVRSPSESKPSGAGPEPGHHRGRCRRSGRCATESVGDLWLADGRSPVERETRKAAGEKRSTRRQTRDERREKRDERREARGERRETRDERRETRDERRERREKRDERRETRASNSMAV